MSTYLIDLKSLEVVGRYKTIDDAVYDAELQGINPHCAAEAPAFLWGIERKDLCDLYQKLTGKEIEKELKVSEIVPLLWKVLESTEFTGKPSPQKGKEVPTEESEVKDDVKDESEAPPKEEKKVAAKKTSTRAKRGSKMLLKDLFIKSLGDQKLEFTGDPFVPRPEDFGSRFDILRDILDRAEKAFDDNKQRDYLEALTHLVYFGLEASYFSDFDVEASVKDFIKVYDVEHENISDDIPVGLLKGLPDNDDQE